MYICIYNYELIPDQKHSLNHATVVSSLNLKPILHTINV